MSSPEVALQIGKDFALYLHNSAAHSDVFARNILMMNSSGRGWRNDFATMDLQRWLVIQKIRLVTSTGESLTDESEVRRMVRLVMCDLLNPIAMAGAFATATGTMCPPSNTGGWCATVSAKAGVGSAQLTIANAVKARQDPDAALPYILAFIHAATGDFCITSGGTDTLVEMNYGVQTCVFSTEIACAMAIVSIGQELGSLVCSTGIAPSERCRNALVEHVLNSWILNRPDWLSTTASCFAAMHNAGGIATSLFCYWVSRDPILFAPGPVQIPPSVCPLAEPFEHDNLQKLTMLVMFPLKLYDVVRGLDAMTRVVDDLDVRHKLEEQLLKEQQAAEEACEKATHELLEELNREEARRSAKAEAARKRRAAAKEAARQRSRQEAQKRREEQQLEQKLKEETRKANIERAKTGNRKVRKAVNSYVAHEPEDTTNYAGCAYGLHDWIVRSPGVYNPMDLMVF